MKPIIAIYIITMTCGLTHSYSAYGNAKRRSSMAAPMMPIFSQVSPQYYDNNRAPNSYIQTQPQYLNVPAYVQPQQQSQQQQQPAPQQQRFADDYRSNPNYFYYPQQTAQQQQQQQQPQRDQYQDQTLYGIPTYHGDYNPKPYYFAQPSFMSQDDRLEATNPLDYLHEEILQENERERNNAAFMQNLALYNKQLDSLQSRQQQMQQIEEMYNLKPTNEFDDYDMIDQQQPSDWYDQTSVVVDPSAYESYIPPQQLQQQQPQYQQQRSYDYDDEMVRELKELKQNRKSKAVPKSMRDDTMPKYISQDYQQYAPSSRDQDEPENYDEGPYWAAPNPIRKTKVPKQQIYSNLDYQQDAPALPSENDQEPENYEDEWINWGGEKRSIQPKKDFADGKQPTVQPQQQQQTVGKQSKQSKVTATAASTSAPMTSSTTTKTTTTEKSKLLSKLHKGGQKEVVLPRPATPVRRPFSEGIMKSFGKSMEGSSSNSNENNRVPPPIYKTIKQIIDMEQNLNHVSKHDIEKNLFYLFMERNDSIIQD